MTSTTTTLVGDLASPLAVLAYARRCQVESDRAQADQFTAAVLWAEQHPPESIGEAATPTDPGFDRLNRRGVRPSALRDSRRPD